ncbi:MAG: hypothetical protein A3F83_02995 [Candidatus Glassbacteria bacterium RIFCSPLOWO2_12_FULL_58_11]|uniref:Glycosyltransferase 2-like domain-containing protein n=1 Tax=Candidatus Glassbacteria bacterium RIFCSPLOWO2_12_FULL_58_11 TaxID=1817867 RepID=A0A1F5YYM9_9BACT|nr:MAG: hypothetical protein A3F83_02995 [Candidatus Glassbacteria bacterium RIFCSPLOWO2_12_FULL_58_11]
MPTSLVSFLIPVYNAHATVVRALESVLGQRRAGELEAVVVDDGSTDGTLELLEKLSSRENRVRLVAVEHRGLVEALITGQRLCRGEFIARMDSDDLAHPDRFREQLALISRDPRLGVVGAQVRYFPRRSLRAGLLHYESWLNSLLEGSRSDAPAEKIEAACRRIEREIFVECPLAHPTFLIRRSAFEQVGGYREFQGLPEDYDLLLRLAGKGWRLGGVGKVLHHWREHPGRTSRIDPRYIADSFRRLKLNHLLSLKLEGGALPVSICGAGPVGKAWLKDLQAAGVEVRFLIEVNPRRIGKKIHGVPVISAEQLASLDRSAGLILGAVGQKGARENIRLSLGPLGYREGEDYLFVA